MLLKDKGYIEGSGRGARRRTKLDLVAWQDCWSSWRHRNRLC